MAVLVTVKNGKTRWSATLVRTKPWDSPLKCRNLISNRVLVWASSFFWRLISWVCILPRVTISGTEASV